ncbi:HAD-like domain-containing protein [Vararia minispora EC-137]|uniref:HAD-like domain-containing protein n=1 Tax=Vararia minispora EC-137 TaxID=1314806 RepID=A0ACB8QLY2_9AGAM|nr:HAD-like domain-containing protein [Vararia minispora EC-137]
MASSGALKDMQENKGDVEMLATIVATSVCLEPMGGFTRPNCPRVSGEVNPLPSADAQPEVQEIWVHLVFTWSGKLFTLDIAESDRVHDLKAVLFSLTNVPPERQKILGLVKGKLPPEDARIGDLNLVSGKKFNLVGTPEGAEIKDPSQLEFLPDVINDLDVDLSTDPVAAAAYVNDQRNKRKVKEATDALRGQVNLINPLRPGKRLLVLDIDYTIVDTKPLTSGALPATECARPGLHDFLTAVYEDYDICIWSQTNWTWLEAKLVELGMIGQGRPYEIAFVLDKSPMFTVFSDLRKDKDGRPYTHHVKALQIIWNLFPQFNAKNTVHVDDLSRNFALNPRNGIKISAYKEAGTESGRADRELRRLSRYLLHIARTSDLQAVDHKEWRKVARNIAG